MNQCKVCDQTVPEYTNFCSELCIIEFLKKYDSMADRGLEFATIAHTGQKRKTGEDFITHPITVSRIATKIWIENFPGLSDKLDNLKCAALLHDVVEDTNYTLDDISKLTDTNLDILEAVRLLTKEDEISYTDYIIRIIESESLIAMVVKIADTTHNLSTWPTDKGSWVDKHKLAKYILYEKLKYY